MKKEIFDGFYEKLNVKTRPGRGGNYSYVTADDVTDRMNRLFEGNWSSMVLFQDVIGENVIVRVRVEATDPESGLTFYHEGFGGHKDDPSVEAGNAFKSAYSKAVVNACRRWGVGLFLDENGDEAPTHKPAPSAPPTVKAPAASPPSPPPTTKLRPTPPPPAEVKPQPVPSVPVPGAKVSATAEITQEPSAPEPSVPAIPKVPIPAAGIPGQEPSPPPISATDTSVASAPDDSMINDVQKISIESLITMRGVPYADMAQGALGRIPEVGTLTHGEAVAVIKFGNDLYKKNKQK